MLEKRYLPQGVYTALVTPFRDGELDKAAWERLVARQIEAGVAGLVPVGCTGEAAALDRAEREWLVRACVAAAKGRCAVVAGAGSNVTRTTIAQTRDAAAWGADAAMLISPYYNKPQQHGLIAHYGAVARAVDLPLVLYNVPGRTAVNILPATVRALAAEPNVVAVKEASGDLRQIADVCAVPDLQVFSGDDGLNLDVYALGGVGTVSVVSNLLPRTLVRTWDAWRAGDAAGARDLAERTRPIVEACFRETNPVPVKELLSLMGLCTHDLRLPLVPALPENRAWLQTVHAGLLGELLAGEGS
ncbi:MAG: 4-hydroxy-tetrahydrodipicolinate synthase [bacterium]|nr:4-hydroxy-tetrahydrodipicolinate synthase [bacterium]